MKKNNGEIMILKQGKG